MTQYKVFSYLAQLLKHHSDKDSVSGRLFRVIGNICQHKDQWANILINQQPILITHGVELLRNYSKDDHNTNTEATVLTTIRALR